MDWILAVIGLVIGAGLGLGGLLFPKRAAGLVRLSEAAPGGFAEFRATYGGLFFGAHAAALYLVRVQWLADDVAIAAMAVGALAVLAAAWGGSAIGRIVSIVRDKTGTPFNWLSVGFETAMALLIGAPWIAWLGGSLAR